MTAFGRRVKVHGADRVHGGLEGPQKARMKLLTDAIQGI